jgi:23S rRNA (uracil1939-C5)-methyltransferase
LQIRIEKLVYGGAGMARTDQGVVFVGKVLPGELVEVEIGERKKDYARAALTRVIEPSPDRQSPACGNFETAGCCGWSHIAYARQLELKDAIIREALTRHGRIEYPGQIPAITGPPAAYRLRARFHISADARLGFVEEGSHTVTAIDHCTALMPQIESFIAEANRALRDRGLEGADSVHVIVSPDTGEVGATVRRGTERASWSHRDPRTRVSGIEYRLRAEAFFQPNRFLLEPMIQEVVAATRGTSNVLDLFCGSAFFSLPIAREGVAVTGVDRRSVGNAIWNARHNKIENVRFEKASAWAFLLHGLKGRPGPGVVILDPPRTGAGKNIVRRVADLAARRIVYVSCNPTTFAPEARILLDQGYTLDSLKFVDQFPNTPHIETIAVFNR